MGELKKYDFSSISVKKEFAQRIERYIKNHPELGYRSIAQFMEDSARRRLEHLLGCATENSE